MSWNARLVRTIDCSQIFRLPHVTDLRSAAESKLAKINLRVHGLRMPVENADHLGTIGQGARPDLDWTFRAHAVTLRAGAVLIDGDHLAIGEYLDSLRRHGAQVISGEQWRRQNCP